MAKTSLKYEEPSWVAKLLVLGFSIAVAFMAGWLVLAILLGNGGSDAVATADDEVPAMVTKQPPRVENRKTAMSRPIVPAPQLLSPRADPASVPGGARKGAPDATASATSPTPASPMALASLPGAPAVAAPDTVPAARSPAQAATDRVAVGDLYAQVTNKIAEDDATEASETIPLPPHRPRTAAVPYSRPRPQQHAEEQTQARADPPSFFDFILGGSR
jgi:hypothetical protein